MAVLRSIDGTFYEVPDESLEQYKVSPEKVKELLREHAPDPEGPSSNEPQGGPAETGYNIDAPGMGVAGGTVVINIFTGAGPGQGQDGPEHGPSGSLPEA